VVDLPRIRKIAPFAYLFRCPICGSEGVIDEDQVDGKDAIICWNHDCSFVGKENLRDKVDEAPAVV